MKKRWSTRTLTLVVAYILISCVPGTVGETSLPSTPFSTPTIGIASTDLPAPVQPATTETVPALENSNLLAFVTDRWEAGNLDIGLMDLENNSINLITGDEWHDMNPSWSPDGLKLAFISSKIDKPNMLRMLDVSTKTIETLVFASTYTGIHSFTWSKDSSSIFYIVRDGKTSASNLWQYSFSTGDYQQLADTEIEIPISISSDGRYLGHATVNSEGYYVFQALDLLTLFPIPIPPDGDPFKFSEVFSPSGIAWSPLEDVAAVTYNALRAQLGQITIYSVERDQLKAIAEAFAAKEMLSYCDPVWSPTGEKLVVIQSSIEANTCQGHPMIYDSRLETPAAWPLGDDVSYVRWSRDGKWIIFSRGDTLNVLQFSKGNLKGPRSELWIADTSEFKTQLLIGDSNYNGQPAWQP